MIAHIGKKLDTLKFCVFLRNAIFEQLKHHQFSRKVRFFYSAFRARSALYNERKTTKVKGNAVILFKFEDGTETV